MVHPYSTRVEQRCLHIPGPVAQQPRQLHPPANPALHLVVDEHNVTVAVQLCVAINAQAGLLQQACIQEREGVETPQSQLS